MVGRLLEGTGKQMETGRPSGAQTRVGGREGRRNSQGHGRLHVLFNYL